MRPTLATCVGQAGARCCFQVSLRVARAHWQARRQGNLRCWSRWGGWQPGLDVLWYNPLFPWVASRANMRYLAGCTHMSTRGACCSFSGVLGLLAAHGTTVLTTTRRTQVAVPRRGRQPQRAWAAAVPNTRHVRALPWPLMRTRRSPGSHACPCAHCSRILFLAWTHRLWHTLNACMHMTSFRVTSSACAAARVAPAVSCSTWRDR